MDSDFQQGALEQTISGLTAGHQYTVSFYWAGGQQYGFNGPTTDQLQVSLGGETLSTSVVDVASHGFSGWMQESMTFTADATSDVLSFFAVGTPQGVPPFALLDGVSLVATTAPEPSTVAMLLSGLVGIGGLVLLRRKSSGKTSAGIN